MDTILSPLRSVVSKPARRAYVQTFLITATAIFLLFTAVLAYILFYFNYIPRISVERPVYLQFSSHYNPNATIDLARDLIPNQPYDVSLNLRVPQSPENISRGNFMLDIEVYDIPAPPPELSPFHTIQDLIDNRNKNLLLHARRPAIMTYSSPFLLHLKTLFYLPLHLFGIYRQEQKLSTYLAKNVAFSVAPKSAVVSIDQGVAVYECTLKFDARFSGLRWIMYNYKLTAFIILTTLFWSTEVVWCGLAWWVVSTKLAGVQEEIKYEETESDDEETFSHSDTQRGFPTATGAPPLQPAEKTPLERLIKKEPKEGGLDADDEDEDEEENDAIGIGSGSDSALGASLSESTGRAKTGSVQRRRSGRG